MTLKTFNEFKNYCNSLKNQALYTISQNKKFFVEIEGNDLYFIPSSSQKRRKANSEKTERVLEKLIQTNSYMASDYKEITFHASYILAVAKSYQTKNIID